MGWRYETRASAAIGSVAAGRRRGLCPRWRSGRRRARPRCCGGQDNMSVSCLRTRQRSGGSPAVRGEALQAWAGRAGGRGRRAARRGHSGG